jgi:lysozyme
MVTSTMFHYLRGGYSDAAAAEFPRWNHASGNVVAGLTKRRLAEQAMFLNGDYTGRP